MVKGLRPWATTGRLQPRVVGSGLCLRTATLGERCAADLGPAWARAPGEGPSAGRRGRWPGFINCLPALPHAMSHAPSPLPRGRVSHLMPHPPNHSLLTEHKTDTQPTKDQPEGQALCSAWLRMTRTQAGPPRVPPWEPENPGTAGQFRSQCSSQKRGTRPHERSYSSRPRTTPRTTAQWVKIPAPGHPPSAAIRNRLLVFNHTAPSDSKAGAARQSGGPSFQRSCAPPGTHRTAG